MLKRPPTSFFLQASTISSTTEPASHRKMNHGQDSCSTPRWSSHPQILSRGDFRGLNNYVARVQSFLQQGMADNEILIYFPIFDSFSDYGKGLLEHFDEISPAFNGTPFRSAADMMIARGYCFDYISDLQLKNTLSPEGLLQTEGNIYSTLIVPGCKFIPVETFTQILRLANNGARIIFYGNLPENISGLAGKDEKTAFFENLKSGINFTPTNNPEVLEGSIWKRNDPQWK